VGKKHLSFSGQKWEIVIGLVALLSVYTVTLFARDLFDVTSESFRGHIYYPWIIAIPQLGLIVFLISQSGSRRLINFLRINNSINYKSVVIVLMTVAVNLGFAAFYSMLMLSAEFDLLMPPEIPKMILGTGWFVIVNLIAVGIFVPIVEEVFFRGFLMVSLARYFGVCKSLFLTSILFACLHAHIGLLVPILFSSITVSLIFLYFKSLWMAICVHSFQNVLVSIVAASS